jgi:1-acyl-sn-glycerol-3-phosphate acyltransferase
MTRLETAIEARTAELVAEATGKPAALSVLVPTPGDAARPVPA